MEKLLGTVLAEALQKEYKL
ncbi:hypothetical protein CL3_20610 [butyrate-producing bacterium SM4/1]|nr:hypothetical protein CLS_04240 [[Clostridium] cf. saccharolyticum K10]CBL36415.1 hypothetical protein CL3_20610 [butyrate-producing bacterium SM4/1]